MKALRIEESVHVASDPTEVFRAWSSAERLAAWFAPMAVRPVAVEMSFEVGGRYRIEMDLGQGGVHTTEGRFEEIVPGERILMTWRCDAWNDPPSRVEVAFRPQDAGTLVTVTHTAIESEPAREGQTFGWRGCLPELKRAVEQGAGES